MTRSVRVSWDLPTVRDDGSPLAVSDLAHVTIGMSADGGSSYVPVGDPFPTSVLETVVNELEDGEWFFSGVVTDAAGRVSKTVTGSIRIGSDSPPGPLTLHLALV